MSLWQYVAAVIAGLVVFDVLLVGWVYAVTRHRATGDQTSDVIST